MSVTVLPRPRRLPAVRHLATGLGVFIVGAVLMIAIIAPYIVPHDPFAQDLNLRLVPPEWMGGTAEHLAARLPEVVRQVANSLEV